VVSYDRFSLSINNVPTLIRGGAMHYFRLPGADLWRDRLIKLKSAGYNTVDLYFNWGFHSSAPGLYDFTGPRDISKLLSITRELGLFVIARPGPYINAETSGGGFPGWLLARRDLPLRNRREGEFEWSDEYMDYVKEWWSHLFPLINASPNVILMQIENEYATPEMEPDTIQSLYNTARELGATVPLFHNDLYIAGLYEDLIDVYAFDNYPITQFTQSWRGAAETFQVIDQLEDTMRDYCMERPLMVAELQAGWFGGWKGDKYEDIRESLGHEQLGIITKSVLAQGLTIFNHYMAIGGTNWNHMGSTEVYTSYDFAAPISENGLPASHFYTAKATNQFLESFAEHWIATLPIKECPIAVDEPSLFYKARHPENLHEAMWLFFRNLSEHERQAVVGSHPVTLQASDMVILPWKMPLQCGVQVDFSSTELLYQNEKLLVVKADRPCQLLLSDLKKADVSARSSDLESKWLSDTQIQLSCPTLDPTSHSLFELPEINILFLGQTLIDTFWIEADGSLLLGPQIHLGDRIAVAAETSAVITLQSNGHIKNKVSLLSLLEERKNESETHGSNVTNSKTVDGLSTVFPSKNETASASKQQISGYFDSFLTAEIIKTEYFNESPELDQNQAAQDTALHFKRVNHAGSDFDANAIYEGSAWYRFTIPATSKKLTICAVHHWCAYLDGHYMGHGENFSIHPGQSEPPEDSHISLPARWNGKRELLVFVSGLGHPKGFHDDAQTPQGIIRFLVDNQDLSLELEILPQTYSQRLEYKSLATALPWNAIPVLRMETQFKLSRSENHYAPWMLKLDSARFERMDILLNGVIIGKDWREGRRQDRFYLPESLLTEGINTLELIIMQFSEPITPKILATKPIQISIEPYKVYQTLPLPL
jgi:hypothetical protein